MAALKSKKKEPSPNKVFVVDDHPVFRRGISALINSQPDLLVCGEAETVNEALEQIDKKMPQIVTVDLTLKSGDGLEIVKALNIYHPDIRSLVLSMHDETVYEERSFKAGAAGYVSKQQADETVLSAIRTVLAGDNFMSDGLKTALAMRTIGGKPAKTMSLVDSLSNRELQVFRLIGGGNTTRQIADELDVSIKTIESHIEHIKGKLNVKFGVDLHHRAVHWVLTDDLG